MEKKTNLDRINDILTVIKEDLLRKEHQLSTSQCLLSLVMPFLTLEHRGRVVDIFTKIEKCQLESVYLTLFGKSNLKCNLFPILTFLRSIFSISGFLQKTF